MHTVQEFTVSDTSYAIFLGFSLVTAENYVPSNINHNAYFPYCIIIKGYQTDKHFLAYVLLQKRKMESY
jgi:hypothetical protein